MTREGHKLRYDHSTGFRSLSFLEIFLKIETNSKICQLLDRLNHLNYTFLRGLCFDHQKNKENISSEKVNTALGQWQQFEESEKRRQRRRNTSNNWVISHCGCREMEKNTIVFLFLKYFNAISTFFFST